MTVLQRAQLRKPHLEKNRTEQAGWKTRAALAAAVAAVQTQVAKEMRKLTFGALLYEGGLQQYAG